VEVDVWLAWKDMEVNAFKEEIEDSKNQVNELPKRETGAMSRSYEESNQRNIHGSQHASIAGTRRRFEACRRPMEKLNFNPGTRDRCRDG
jgi:hypothetical protein